MTAIAVAFGDHHRLAIPHRSATFRRHLAEEDRAVWH